MEVVFGKHAGQSEVLAACQEMLDYFPSAT